GPATCARPCGRVRPRPDSERDDPAPRRRPVLHPNPARAGAAHRQLGRERLPGLGHRPGVGNQRRRRCPHPRRRDRRRHRPPDKPGRDRRSRRRHRPRRHRRLRRHRLRRPGHGADAGQHGAGRGV
ncbi:MAG: hypothetical protein AVDCRST_MAG19-4441, partial [uncultured Thermomicrobiales bacterium]